ncbi:MAG: hypothetical protein HQL66_12520 [Magnetococcales bacterium]|nr:hypothetical protein [Magnetococcales bacterium]
MAMVCVLWLRDLECFALVRRVSFSRRRWAGHGVAVESNAKIAPPCLFVGCLLWNWNESKGAFVDWGWFHVTTSSDRIPAGGGGGVLGSNMTAQGAGGLRTMIVHGREGTP